MPNYTPSYSTYSPAPASSPAKQPTYEERSRPEQRRSEPKPVIIYQGKDARVSAPEQGFPVRSKYQDSGYHR